MGKHKGTKGRGVIAIALFQQATALERWADAQERIALSNESIAATHEANARTMAADIAFRQQAAAEFAALPESIEELRQLLIAAIQAGAVVMAPNADA